MSDNCCTDTTIVTPPINEIRGGVRRSKGGNLFDVENPIPAEVEDSDSLKKVFSDYKLVPYAGRDKSTGHSLLYWRLMLAQLSPMNGACLQKIKKYVVGSRAKFVRAEDPEFDPGTEIAPLSPQESAIYEAAIKEMVEYKGGVRALHQALQWSALATGNAWAELSVSTINGQTRAVIKHLKATHCMYKVTKPGQPRLVAVSPVWTEDYLKKNEPAIIPLAPNFLEKDGVMRTIFHLKIGDGEWYGRPDSESSDLYKYREVQDAMYIIKQSAANFVGQLIIEVEDDDAGDPAINYQDAQRSGFDSFADRMRENYTQSGADPQSVIVTARPMGSRPMFVFQIKPNTNENWYKVTGEMSEQKILRSHGLSLRFMGFDAANGLSNDAFASDYVMNVEPVIREHRNTLTAFSNKILDLIWEVAGRQELSQYSLTFESPIKGEIEQFKTASNANPNNNNAV